MFARIVVAIAMISFLVSANAQARELTTEQKLADFNQLVTSIKSAYGPLLYKSEEIGIDTNQLVNQYEKEISASTSNREFYYLVVKFVAAFKDSHFSARVPTSQVGTLGFTTDLVAGKVVIDSIEDKDLSGEKFPFERGDEIVSINGVASEQLVEQLAGYVSMGFEGSAKRAAAMLVSRRPGNLVPVERGKAQLVIRPRQQPWVEHTVELPWQISGKAMDEEEPKIEESLVQSRWPIGQRYRRAEDFMISLAPLYEELFGERAEKSFQCSGSTRIKIPANATVIMREPFVAYYHPTPKGNVGYLRIPHYMPKNDKTGALEFDLRFAQYEYAVSVLEKETVGLVIDQDHNCGGSVAYLERMLGLFVGHDYQPMQFRFLASKGEYLEFKNWLDAMEKNTVSYKKFEEVTELIYNTWRDTGDYLTPFTSISGDEDLQPNRIRYTKPIVMLIDEMSGSGGDAFPAYMQGNNRATLIGTRTMGAGGHVVALPNLSYSGISVRMTKSLFFRPDGVCVENNGAEPDHQYDITLNDYVDGYAEYQQFYLDRLYELL